MGERLRLGVGSVSLRPLGMDRSARMGLDPGTSVRSGLGRLANRLLRRLLRWMGAHAAYLVLARRIRSWTPGQSIRAVRLLSEQPCFRSARLRACRACCARWSHRCSHAALSRSHRAGWRRLPRARHDSSPYPRSSARTEVGSPCAAGCSRCPRDGVCQPVAAQLSRQRRTWFILLDEVGNSARGRLPR